MQHTKTGRRYIMTYHQEILLKNGKTALLRSGGLADGAGALENFLLTRGETDYLLTYPDETTMTPRQEGEFLAGKTADPRGLELVAIVDGKIVGMAGFDGVGTACKVRHRADFGIAIAREYRGLGLGRAMTGACIACARVAGYTQLELSVVAENEGAIALYRAMGFQEYGRDPRGFRSRSGYQTLAYMRLALSEEENE